MMVLWILTPARACAPAVDSIFRFSLILLWILGHCRIFVTFSGILLSKFMRPKFRPLYSLSMPCKLLLLSLLSLLLLVLVLVVVVVEVVVVVIVLEVVVVVVVEAIFFLCICFDVLICSFFCCLNWKEKNVQIKNEQILPNSFLLFSF